MLEKYSAGVWFRVIDFLVIIYDGTDIPHSGNSKWKNTRFLHWLDINLYNTLIILFIDNESTLNFDICKLFERLRQNLLVYTILKRPNELYIICYQPEDISRQFSIRIKRFSTDVNYVSDWMTSPGFVLPRSFIIENRGRKTNLFIKFISYLYPTSKLTGWQVCLTWIGMKNRFLCQWHFRGHQTCET